MLKYSLSSSFPSNLRSLDPNGGFIADADFFENELNDAAVFIDIVEAPALARGLLKILLALLIDCAP